jgi:hypothetical protein
LISLGVAHASAGSIVIVSAPVGLQVVNEPGQHLTVALELVAKRPPDPQIIRNCLSQLAHDALPVVGHGRASSRNERSSTLAWIAVLNNWRWRNTCPTSGRARTGTQQLGRRGMPQLMSAHLGLSARAAGDDRDGRPVRIDTACRRQNPLLLRREEMRPLSNL